MQEKYNPVYVLNKDGTPLMPTTRYGKVRRMLRDGEAEIVNHVLIAGDGTIINSDLNGSANIGRKCYPDMYERGQQPDFNNVIVIVHPDYAKVVANQHK